LFFSLEENDDSQSDSDVEENEDEINQEHPVT
jgi:hypothetical protein